MKLSALLPGHRRTVFLIGLLLGLLHLPLSLEISVSLTRHGSMVRSLLLLLYPVALALTGMGAALAQSRPETASRPGPLRLAGASLLFFLLAALRSNFLSPDGVVLVISALLHLLALGAWFLLLGFSLAGAITREKSWDESHVGIAWALHLLGLVVGYLCSEILVVHVGPNALLLSAGASLLLWPRYGLVLMGAALVLCQGLDVDMNLEVHRQLQGWEQIDADNAARREQDYSRQRARRILAAETELVYLGWSRFGQVRVLQTDNSRYLVLYNLKRQYDVKPFEVGDNRQSDIDTSEVAGHWRLRDTFYSLFAADEKLLIIGVGSGRGSAHLDFEPSSTVTLVERDAAAARYFAEVNPEINDHLFSQVNFEVADGRHVVETSGGSLDAIVIESARYQPPHSMLPASSPFYLFTREAIATYLEKLNESGVLAIEFTRTTDGAKNALVPAQVLDSLQALGATYTVYNTEPRESILLLASPPGGDLEQWTNRMDPEALGTHTRSWEPIKERLASRLALTDAHPFVGWQALRDEARHTLFAVAGGILLLGLLGLGLLYRFRPRQEGRWNGLGFCFLVGIAHALVTMHTFYTWRSYYGDELLTILRLMVAFLITGALGAACTQRLAPRLPGRAGRVLLVLGVLGLHLAASACLPFEESRAWIREIYGLLAVFPAGFTLGLFLPLGLAVASREDLGRNLCADALGALVAYALVYLVYLPFGGPAYVALGIGMYMAAAALLERAPAKV